MMRKFIYWISHLIGFIGSQTLLDLAIMLGKVGSVGVNMLNMASISFRSFQFDFSFSYELRFAIYSWFQSSEDGRVTGYSLQYGLLIG